jgi:hypothetical protein
MKAADQWLGQLPPPSTSTQRRRPHIIERRPAHLLLVAPPPSAMLSAPPVCLRHGFAWNPLSDDKYRACSHTHVA